MIGAFPLSERKEKGTDLRSRSLDRRRLGKPVCSHPKHYFRESKIPRIELTKRHYFVAFIIYSQKEKMSSSRKSKKEESDTSPSDEALEEVNNHIKEAFEILKRETKKVRMEKEALDEAAKKLEHVHFSSMLKLNVGGHLFSTSLSTLNKDPGMFLN